MTMQLIFLNILNILYACGTIQGMSPFFKSINTLTGHKPLTKEQKLTGHEPSTYWSKYPQGISPRQMSMQMDSQLRHLKLLKQLHTI